jgi:hypothetical protein
LTFCNSFETSRSMRGEFFVGQESEQRRAVRICPSPNSIEPIVQASVNILSREGAMAGVPALPVLQAVEAAVELLRQARGVDSKVAQDVRHVAIGRIEQFAQKMLDFNIVMGTGQRQAGSTLERGAGRLVQFADQAF